ncbi:MAG: hypothetical protein E7017_03990 [Alphaproteobacteria bacterium]|nr:hypothetical protein [Alphaproteobacteria bacterium]
MIEQLMSFDFFSALSMKFEFLAHAIDTYMTEANNLRLVSFVLMMLAIVLFLFLIVIIYVRNIIFFVRNNNPAKNIKDESDEEDLRVFDDEEQQELERELQRELEMALADRQAIEQRELQEQQEKQRVKEIKAEQKKQKKEKLEKEILEKEEQERTELKLREKHKEPMLDFDWKKGKIPTTEIQELSSISFSYKQSRQELNQLMGLAIDMLGRGVDDLKIAQTLNFKNQGTSDENDILKAIDALKSFINLSLSGKFAKLAEYGSLPSEEQALLHLANGDSSLALALLENLMDAHIDKANASTSEDKRQRLYSEASEFACCFGALAELNDIMLATSAYELAIELQSTNVVAWGRLGDVYKAASSTPKAMWAYQNVLDFADEEIDVAQIANAKKHLSEHLYAEGNSLQAAKLYNSAKQYYDSLGINRRLDKQELEIIDIIESNHSSSLPEMIYKLLGKEYSE